MAAKHNIQHSAPAPSLLPLTRLHQPLLLQVDGTPGVRRAGMSGIGVVVRDARGQIVTWRCLRAPACTCNEAEYQAVIAGLELAYQHYPTATVRCLSDSQVVVGQITGRCIVRAPALQPLHTRAVTLLDRMPAITFVVIPRELNRLADALAWEALSGRQQLVRQGAR